MLQVVINVTLVKGLSYDTQTTSFHQWTDQSQTYGLNFTSEQDALVFGNGVFTSLENLKTIGKAFKCCSNFLFIPHAVTKRLSENVSESQSGKCFDKKNTDTPHVRHGTTTNNEST